MSIASLFKPVDSSKTRLPRTDVLERVAKYADGKSVVSNYFDISTEELINMLRKDLVPASEIEYVSDIVRTRLSGETTAAPKKSVGETIKNTAKDFTVSDPTKDFITLEDIIGTSSAPSGFERGNYLESLIGSGTTGGPTQRGTPAKGVASADSVDFERGKYLESLIGSGTMGGAPQRGSPAKDKDYTDPLNARPDAPPARLGLEGLTPGRRPSGGMSYTPEAPEDSASIRQAALGSAEDRQNALDFLKKNQAVIDYYSKQRGEDPTGVGINTDQKVGDDLQKRFKRETLGTSGFFASDPPAFVAGADPTRTTNVPVLQDFQRGTGSDGDFGSGFSSVSKDTQRGSGSAGDFGSGFSTPQSEIDAYKSKILQEKFDKERAGTSGFFADNNESGISSDSSFNPVKIDTGNRSGSEMSPPIRSSGIGDTFKKQGVGGVAKVFGKNAAEVGQDLYRILSRPVVPNQREMLTEGKPFELPTQIALGEEGVQQDLKDYYDRERRKVVDPTGIGISALPSSTGGAAEAGTRGIAPAARNNDRGVGEPTAVTAATAVTAPPASIGGRYVPPAPDTSSRDSAPSTSSQSSATPTTDYRAAPDKPTKDDVADIKKAANEVAKNPSVGGIQSLFEQAGFSDTLLQLGLGMMASKNPDFLGSLGEAGQGAVALMAKQREAAKKAKDDADRLALDTRRVAADELRAKTDFERDKDPAALQNAKLVASSITTALAQAKAGVTGTPEQIIARQHIAGTAIPAAERAAAAAAKAWQTGFNKIQDIPSTTQKQAALAEFYKMNGRDPDEAEYKAYQASIDRSDPQGILQIGIPKTEDPKAPDAPYDPATYRLIPKAQ